MPGGQRASLRVCGLPPRAGSRALLAGALARLEIGLCAPLTTRGGLPKRLPNQRLGNPDGKVMAMKMNA